jgi:hypothetical protein
MNDSVLVWGLGEEEREGQPVIDLIEEEIELLSV